MSLRMEKVTHTGSLLLSYLQHFKENGAGKQTSAILSALRLRSPQHLGCLEDLVKTDGICLSSSGSILRDEI